MSRRCSPRWLVTCAAASASATASCAPARAPRRSSCSARSGGARAVVGRPPPCPGAGWGPGALELLGEIRGRGENVALLVADQRMPGMAGTDYLVQARIVVPEAKRVLLTAYADTEAAIAAINDVALDYYLLQPWDPPEEQLLPVVEDLL